jgi:GntR family transcriptional regulator
MDFRSGQPIYLQIVKQVERQTAARRLRPGDQLPTVRGLADELDVNFNTVARAYRLLDEAGVVSTQRGRGTYIIQEARTASSTRARRERLESLAGQYIAEAKRHKFSEEAIERMVRVRLKSWKEA